MDACNPKGSKFSPFRFTAHLLSRMLSRSRTFYRHYASRTPRFLASTTPPPKVRKLAALTWLVRRFFRTFRKETCVRIRLYTQKAQIRGSLLPYSPSSLLTNDTKKKSIERISKNVRAQLPHLSTLTGWKFGNVANAKCRSLSLTASYWIAA